MTRLPLSRPSGGRPFRSRPKPVADFIDRCLGESLAAQGFAASDIILAWPDIVGERLAKYSQPIRMEWPRRGAEPAGRDNPRGPATLVVRVAGAFALDLQHMAPVVVERVNTHYGWACVGRLVLKQGPVRRETKQPRVLPQLAAGEREKLDEALAPIETDGLKAALDRLGKAVLGTARPG